MGESGGELRMGGYGKWLVLIVLCLSSLCGSVTAVINPGDLSVLNVLASTWRPSKLNWTRGDPCSSKWQGVTCDQTNTRVTNLVLSSTGISGTIPSSIGNLSSLVNLDLSYNVKLGGILPLELGQLGSLQVLSLQGCSFTGTIPDTLSNISSLTFLALNVNNLTGALPPSLGKLAKLWWFDVSSNNLSGPLPTSTNNQFGLDSLRYCAHFHLNNNSFTGPIPSELGEGISGVPLSSIIHLLLDSNQLSGTIPASLGNLSTLQILSLSNNRLTGPIPPSLSGIVQAGVNTSLQQLLVANNQLNGTIPDLSALTGLQLVDFSNNSFNSQPFPAWLSNSTMLQTINVEYDHLTGLWPAGVLGIPMLQTLRAQNNSLNGSLTIPAKVPSGLKMVSLQDNQISAVVQQNISANLSAISFELLGNPICSSTNLAKPQTLCADNASSLQPWHSPLTPSSSCALQSCSGNLEMNLQNRNNCACAQPLTVYFEIRQPAFSVITDTLMNTLQSQLAQGLGLLLTQVWIYDAVFTNNGRVVVTIYFFPPDGSQALSSEISTNIIGSLGQQKLDPFLGSAFKPYMVLSGSIQGTTSSNKSLSKGAIIGIVIGGLLAAFLIAIVASAAIIQKRRADKLRAITQPFAAWGGGDNGEAPQVKGAKPFSFSELKKATNNFSDSNEIGAGGYGKVYSGTLVSGKLVAVKRAQEGSMQGLEEFKNEIELLSRVHHKNLVDLVGYCYDQKEQMLVYEFMVKGTLREWLVGTMAHPLDWSMRLAIATGSARGLAYLHELANPPIIHRDIKSSNILLDENLVAKVADFGLSKLAPDGADKLLSTAQVKGTLGYLDPEYFMTKQLSEKSDVYSFGVVLLELLTARAPIHHGKYVVREVRTALDKGGMAAFWLQLDPLLRDAPPEELEKVLNLALDCVEEKGVDRPTMNIVVKRLEVLTGQNNLASGGKGKEVVPDMHEDVYGEQEIMQKGGPGSFQYSGGYTPTRPEPK